VKIKINLELVHLKIPRFQLPYNHYTFTRLFLSCGIKVGFPCCVCAYQFHQLTEFHEMLYESYAITGHPNSILETSYMTNAWNCEVGATQIWILNWCTMDRVCCMFLSYIVFTFNFWSTMLQAGTSRVRFPMRALDFSIYLTLPAALWPWGLLSL
jgi:hypothetical protein